MITVELKLNGEPIAVAHFANISGLAARSDYAVTAQTTAHPVSGAPAVQHRLTLRDHDRAASPWGLVRRLADALSGESD